MLSLFFIVYVLFSEATAQDCASGSFYDSINANKFTVATGTWYLNTGAPSTCSGQVDKYDVSYYSFTGGAHSVYVALWRPISTGSTTYKMVDSSVQKLTQSSQKRRKRASFAGHVDFAHPNLYARKGAVVGVFFLSTEDSLPIIGTKNNQGHQICIQPQSSLTATELNCSSVPTDLDELIHAMATINDNVECNGGISTIGHGTSSLIDGDMKYGARAQYTCDTGYVITSGDEYLVCNENGQWAGTPPTCTITCPSITSISNGSVNGTAFIYQSTLSFTCDTGYELEGVSSITCQISGQWSNSIPVCTIVNCSDPGTPENGKKIPVDATFTYQSVIIYECNDGFEIHGNSSIVCTSSGDWNSSLPICTAVMTSTPVDITSNSFSPSDMNTNTIITTSSIIPSQTTIKSLTSNFIGTGTTSVMKTSTTSNSITVTTGTTTSNSIIASTGTTSVMKTSTTSNSIVDSTTTSIVVSLSSSSTASDSTHTKPTANVDSSSIADSSLSVIIPTFSTSHISTAAGSTSSTLVRGSNPSLFSSNIANNSLLTRSTTGVPSKSVQEVTTSNSPLGATVGVMAVLLIALIAVIVVILLFLLIKRKRKERFNISAVNNINTLNAGFDNFVYDDQNVIGINATTGYGPNTGNSLYEDLPDYNDAIMTQKHKSQQPQQQQEQQRTTYEPVDQYKYSSLHPKSLRSRSVVKTKDGEYFELEDTIPPDLPPRLYTNSLLLNQLQAAETGLYETSVDLYSQVDEPSALQEEPIYWQPETSRTKIYEQLASKKYREIPPEKIMITDHLGSGQFGTVEKGLWYSKKGPVTVAIKTLKGIASEEEEIKFLQEAAINGQFHHPNVVELYGVVTAGQPIMIILEYIPNGDLKEFLMSKRPKPGDTDSNKEQLIKLLINFSKQIASGMVYLSGKRFIHRDLAARNVLVADNNICKIADFGMSRDLQDEAYYRSNSKRIPVKWTAPEAIHYRKYSTESDVWSFGSVLYEIWSVGHKPFQLYTNQECIDLIDSGFRISAPLGCPKFIYNLMIMCWNLVVSERPTFEYLQAELLKTSTIFEEAVSLKASLGSSIDNDRSLYPELQYKYKSVN